MMLGPGVLLLLPFLGGGLPQGMPPLPEDPVMSRAAPEECILYATWAGMDTPDPQSENQTEQLLAEEEIQQLVVELEKRIVDAIREQAGDEPGVDVVLNDTSLLVKTLLTAPGAVFLSEFDVPGSAIINGEIDVRGGAIINLGTQVEEVNQTLQMLELMAFGLESPGAIQDEGDSLAGWRSLPAGPGDPAVEWGIRGHYLIIGIGPGEADAIFARAKTSAPPWLVELREELTVPRPASFTHINLVRFLEIIREIVEVFDGGDVARPIETLGLGNLQSLSSIRGLDDVGCVSKTLLKLDGEPTGLLSLALAKPLSKDDLSPIPPDATIALAAGVDLNAYVAQILEAVGGFDSDAREELLEELGQLEEFLGFRIREDLFASLGDTWCVYGSPSEGSFFITGATAVVNVRDADALNGVSEKLATWILEEFKGEDVVIDSFSFGEETVYFFKFIGEQIPFAPAWCVTDEELIVATFPQHVKAYLTNRTADNGSLADIPEVARLFQSSDQPVAISYVDTREIVRVLYPMAQVAGRAVCGMWQEEGIDIDISLLPSATTFLRHMQPSTSTFGRTESGVAWETHRTIPGGRGLIAAPMAAFAAVPFTMGSSGDTWEEFAAEESLGMSPYDMSPPLLTSSPAKSTNNMKMIGLALHNYHDTYRHFPTDTYSEAGAPQLSWRVKILPFLEERALHDEFHLDEPWNSPHNRELIARMPAVFGAENGRRTNYLGVAGRGGIFSSGEGVSFADITDGTSNTVMVVEASDDEAVLWTRPDDFLFDEDKPTGGLGLGRNGFLALFCDGSVRALAETLDPETLRRLFFRNDGQPVSLP